MSERTIRTTTLIGNHVWMAEKDHDELVSAVNVGIAARKDNALLREVVDRLVVLAVKHCNIQHCDFREIKTLARKLEVGE